MTAHDLLSAVLADPFDDLPRLILADWLEENEDPERAKFIRDNIQQCDRCSPHLYDADNTYGIGYHPERDPASGRHEGGWTNCKSCNGGGSGGIRKRFTDHDNEILKKVVYIARRGFVDEIRCTMAQWVGGEDCYIHDETLQCNRCKGTGRTPGIAKAVCESWPVTRVVLTDRKPMNGDNKHATWHLCRNDETSYFDFELPPSIYHKLRAPKKLNTMGKSLGVIEYPSAERALAALSHAALKYGRRLAGFPEINK